MNKTTLYLIITTALSLLLVIGMGIYILIGFGSESEQEYIPTGTYNPENPETPVNTIDGAFVEVLPPTYTNMGWWSEGLLAVANQVEGAGLERWGFVDATGELVIPLQWMYVSAFSEGLAAVWVNDKWGFIDTDGNTVIQPRYEQVEAFSQGRAAVMRNGLWGFIDTQGNEIVPPRYMTVRSFSNGLAAVAQHNATATWPFERWGFISLDGNVAVPLRYDFVNCFSEGYAAVFNGRRTSYPVGFNGVWHVINTAGEYVLADLPYGRIWRFHEGAAATRRDVDGVLLIGFMEPDGNWVIEPQFDRGGGSEGYNFQNGVSVQRHGNEEFALVSRSGEILIPLGEDTISDFVDGYAVFGVPDLRCHCGRHALQDGPYWGIINTRGEVTVPRTLTHEELRIIPGGLVLTLDGCAEVGYTMGVLTVDGTLVNVQPFAVNGLGTPNADGIIPFMRDGIWGLVTIDAE